MDTQSRIRDLGPGTGSPGACNQPKGTAMSLKLKALGLGLLAAMAMSSVAVMNASATTTGHFSSDSPKTTTVVGSEGGTHFTELTSHGLENGIVCDETSYHGSAATGNVPSLTIKPHYTKCHTTGAAVDSVTVTVNGCHYLFTPGGTKTVHLTCPENKSIEIHHPNCTIKITPQTVEGVEYTTTTENGKHTITLDANTVDFDTKYEGGICIFTGTNHVGTLHGSVTVKGLDAEKLTEQVNITAT